MARAKRTSRAEARRRYRAQLAAEANAADVDGQDDGIEDAEGANADRAAAPGRISRRPTRTARTATTGSAAATGGEAPQSGIRYAFRAAFRPANIRDDLAHLPQIVLSRAVIIPSAISIGTAIGLAATGGNELFSRLLAQYFLVPPPIGSVFIAGFFAKRASYIAGFVVGLVAALALTALLTILPALGGGTAGLGPVATPTPISSATPAPTATASVAASSTASGSPSATASPSASPSATTPASPTPSPSPAPPVDTTEVATYALVTSPIAGILFASAAAWYRRFLQLSNPNRAARANRNARGRPSNSRRR